MTAVAHSAVLVLEDGIDPTPIEQALPPGARVTKATLPDAAYLWASLTKAAAEADLVVFACSHEHERTLEGIASLSRQLAKRPPLVVLHTGSSNGFMQRAFSAGADDLITLPQPTQELAFSLEKAIARRRGAAAPMGEGAMITVLGPKGGTGKTLTACNLAVALAQSGCSAAIIDLDLQFGDVGLALGLRPNRTIYDLATAGSSLDAEKIDGFLTEHASGAHALLAPIRPDQAAAITIPFLRTVFETLRSRHDLVIVDTPPAFSPEVIAAIDDSSDICLVGHARRALAEGHEDRSRDPGADGLRRARRPTRAEPRRLERRASVTPTSSSCSVGARRARPERPRDPARHHRRPDDRRGRSALGRGARRSSRWRRATPTARRTASNGTGRRACGRPAQVAAQEGRQ